MSEVEFTHNPNLLTTGGNTVLHIAVLRGELNLAIQFLMQKPELLKIKNAYGDTPLHLAARACQVDMVEHFVSHASLSSLSPHELVREMNNVGNTALHEAALNDCLPVVVVLLGAAPSASALVAGSNGASALYMAAIRCSTSIVMQLLRIGEASCEGPNGQTALHAAVSTASYEMADSLAKERPTLLTRADVEGNTPLHLAAFCGDCRMVRVLLESDLSAVYLRDKNGLTPIHVATNYGHLSVVLCLIEKCPDCVELVDNKGWNFFHVAIRKVVVSVVDYVLASATLIKLVNVPDKNGNTPMHLAVLSGSMQVVNKLTSCTEFIACAINHDGDTAFDVALETDISGFGFTMSKKSKLALRMMMLMSSTSFNSIHPLRFSPLRLKQIVDCFTSPPDLDDEYVEATNFKSWSKSLSVVATLIATATFAAVFALPGGYQSDQGQDPGTAWLTKRAAFDAFLVFDAFAMVISLLVCLSAAEPGPKKYQIHEIYNSYIRLSYAILAFVSAFACGVFVVIADKRLYLAVLICIIVLAPFARDEFAQLFVQNIPRFARMSNLIGHVVLVTETTFPFCMTFFYLKQSSPFRNIYDKMIISRVTSTRKGRYNLAFDVIYPGCLAVSLTEHIPNA